MAASSGTTKTVDFRAKRTMGNIVPCDNNLQNLGGANTAAVCALTGRDGKPVVIAEVVFGYSAVPVAGSLQITDGTNTFGPMPVTVSGVQSLFLAPYLSFASPATITLAAGGGTTTSAVYANVISE